MIALEIVRWQEQVFPTIERVVAGRQTCSPTDSKITRNRQLLYMYGFLPASCVGTFPLGIHFNIAP